MNYQNKSLIYRTQSSISNINNASLLLLLFLLASSQLIACSGARGNAEEEAQAAVAASTPAVTPEPTVTAIPSATATQTPTLIPSKTPTAQPTKTPTPTITPSSTYTPTPDPAVEYLTLVYEFLEGSVEIQNVPFESEMTEDKLETYEQLLTEVMTINQDIVDFDDPLPGLRPLIIETIEVCMTANEGMVTIARHRNATGRMLGGEADVFEVFEASNVCKDELIPQFLEAIGVD